MTFSYIIWVIAVVWTVSGLAYFMYRVHKCMDKYLNEKPINIDGMGC